MWRLAVFALVWAAHQSAFAERVRVTTWNMEWFPSGSPTTVSPAAETSRIAEAATHLKSLDSDILLLQEIRDWDACERLAAALAPLRYHVIVCSAFRDGFSGNVGKQQVAILAKKEAQAAWSESWKNRGKIDPPRGFAFAAIRYGDRDVGFYSLHLKSKLVRRNGDMEAQLNIAKRESAADQLIQHIRDVRTSVMPSVSAFVVGGDFNTNKDQPLFISERTLDVIQEADFTNTYKQSPLPARITHPGSGRYPDATFDYIFLQRARPIGLPRLARSNISDHLSVTCDVEL
jgi:endonuclease/exonuclease/phosphatase family metal-dependent hydrolase